jgi:hypothetical protein
MRATRSLLAAVFPLVLFVLGPQVRTGAAPALGASAGPSPPLELPLEISSETGSDDFTQVEARVAAGTDVLFVVWTDFRNGEETANGDIYGARVRASDGMILDPKGIPICMDPALQRLPAVASDGADFLVVWEDQRNEALGTLNSDVYGARVRGADGHVLDPDGRAICSQVNGLTSFQGRPAVAGAAGNGFLAVWEDGRNHLTQREVYGTRVRSSDGFRLDGDGVRIGRAGAGQVLSEPVAAVTSGLYLVAWAASNPDGLWGVSGARVRAADAAVLDPEPIAIRTAGAAVRALAAAGGADRFFVVWEDDRNNGIEFLFQNPDIFGARVGLDGRVPDPGGLSICTQTSSQQHPTVAAWAVGREFVVAWEDWRDEASEGLNVYFAHVDERTAKVAEHDDVPSSNRANLFQADPALALGGGAALVAWTGGSTNRSRSDIAGALLRLSAPPAAELRLGQPRFRDSDRFQFRVAGPQGVLVAVERSDDLATWNAVATNRLSAEGWEYAETVGLGSGSRYYRAVTKD